MVEKYERQLKKGILDMLVLNLLHSGSMYGYQIIQKLKEDSDQVIILKDGTLYPILYRLEDEGLVESKWSEAEGKKVARKYYKITDTGVKKLGEIIETWDMISGCVNQMVGRHSHDEKEIFE